MKRMAWVAMGYLLFFAGMYIVFRGTNKMIALKDTPNDFNQLVYVSFTMSAASFCTIPGAICLAKFGKEVEPLTFFAAAIVGMFFLLRGADVVIGSTNSNFALFEAMTIAVVAQCTITCCLSFTAARKSIADALRVD